MLDRPDNSQLIYDYTRELYNVRSANIDSLNTRTAAVLAAAIATTKLILDLPHADTIWNYQFYVRCGAFLSIVLCVVLCSINFFTKFTGGVADPFVMADEEHIDRPTEELRYWIVSYWAHSIPQFERVIDRKKNLLNLAAISILCSIFFLLLAFLPKL